MFFVSCGIIYKLPNNSEYEVNTKSSDIAKLLRTHADIPLIDKYVTEEVDNIEIMIQRINQLMDTLNLIPLSQTQRSLYTANNVVMLDIERIMTIAKANDIKRSDTGVQLEEVYKGIHDGGNIILELANYFRTETGTSDLTDLYVFKVGDLTYLLPLKDKVIPEEEVKEFFKEKGLEITITEPYRITSYKTIRVEETESIDVKEKGFVDIRDFSLGNGLPELVYDDIFVEFQKRFVK